MSKAVLLGDTHFGVRDGHVVLHQFFDRVYTDWFFELCVEHDIKVIYQFGDLFDKRKGVDSFSITESKRYFFDKLRKYGITLHVLIGNHDAYFTNTIIVNSPDLLLDDYVADGTVVLYQKPTTINIGTKSVDIIPWICKDNYDEVMAFVEASESDLCFGHFEFAGYPMYKGVDSHGGMSPSLFKKYEHVYSGHYHTRSSEGNITYLGTPCELTWNDVNDPRGIYVMRGPQIAFYACPFTLHAMIVYNEDEADLKKLPDIKDKYVKLVVEKRTDFKKYDKYIAALNDVGPLDLKIIEDLSDFNQEKVDDEELVLNDTASLISGYIDEVDTDLDKDRLKREMHLLFVEAKAMDV